jgi:hypothetical protein
VKSYEATATIDAGPDVVWSVLKDGSAYRAWGSGVEQVEGSIATGERIKVHAAVSPGRAFPVKVQIDEAGGTMTWTGGMPLGLFRGVRTFTVTPMAGGGTDFKMREEYTGPMLGLIWKSMPDLGPSFQQFAAALKVRAEQATRDA